MIFQRQHVCEICSKLTVKTPERHPWRRSGVSIVNFERVSDLVLVLLFLTLAYNCRLGKTSENVNLKRRKCRAKKMSRS